MTDPYNLLWTGGWDSTFRLFQILTTTSEGVQPYYIIDPNRLSTREEIFAMSRIKASAIAMDESYKSRIKDTIYYNADDFISDLRIDDALSDLQSRSHLGKQYAMLAKCVKTYGISDLELSIHRDDKAYDFVRAYIETDRENKTRLKPEISDKSLEIFRPFLFPILDHQKTDMQQIAKKKGFFDAMNETWFCHTPDHGKPCGICKPCRYTIEEGLAFRIPTLNRYKYNLAIKPISYLYRKIRKYTQRSKSRKRI